MADWQLAEVFPPGDFIREEMEHRGWTQQDLAEILGKPLPSINQILMGKKSIVIDTAHRLSAAFGTSAQFWMNLETSWQLHNRTKTSELKTIQSRAQIYELAPIRELEKRGWIKKTTKHEDRDAELRRLYKVESLDQVPAMACALRASVGGEPTELTAAQWAWCLRSCQIAKAAHAKTFRHNAINKAVVDLRRLMADPEESRHAARVLAGIGIRLVIVEHLKKTRMDGAALWPNDRTPVIALSLRYGRLDHFWFTLMHELAHIFYRDKTQVDVRLFEPGTPDAVESMEARANQQAADWIVDQEKLNSFILRTTPLYSTRRITNFARRMGVHPSIVVGQLKHRHEIEWSKMTRLNIDARDIIRDSTMCDGWGRVLPELD